MSTDSLSPGEPFTQSGSEGSHAFSGAAALIGDGGATLSDAVPAAGEDSEQVSGSGRDILVVDDKEANLIAIEAALEPLGRKLVLVQSGMEALSAVLKQDFALILLDVQMPELDGFETARLMRSRTRFRNTPIIFVTGISWPKDTDLRGYQLGAFDFLMKPIRAELLRAKVSVFIELQDRTFELQEKSAELRAQQQRAHEAELQRASAVQFETLVNSLPLLAWHCTPDGQMGWYNHRWYEYIGVPEGQAEGPQRANLLDEQDRERVRSKWMRCLQAGEPWEDVFRLRRHDGQYRWFLARAAPYRDRSGRIVRWFGTNVDIDDQKKAEAAAAAAGRAKDEFLAMLGHELRNPLAPIQTALDLMELRIPDVAKPERSIIERQVAHLTRMVDDLLDVSRIIQGKIALRFERTTLSEVVTRAVELVSPLFERKSHELVVSLPDENIPLRGDIPRLVQLVANVLTNAAKYTQPRGAIHVRARVLAGAEASRAQLRVRDNGIGISEALLPKIFDLFTQEQQGVDRAQGGLGLGLAIARSVAEMHGGTIVAISEGQGHGAEFVIELPISGRVTSHGEDAQVAQADTPLAPLRVLVVDDNEDAAELLAEALSKSGYVVRYAFDGPAALSLVSSFVPDIAVLDLGLPVMDGYELVAQLRATNGLERTRYIAVTGYGQAEDRQRSQEAGFHLHLVKPINLKQVREAISTVTSTASDPTKT